MWLTSYVHMFQCMQVVCTGKEERLIDCHFPEEFGNAVPADYDYSAATPTPLPASTAPAPDPGIDVPGNLNDCTLIDNDVFGVVCRRFELTGVFAQTSIMPRSLRNSLMFSL